MRGAVGVGGTVAVGTDVAVGITVGVGDDEHAVTTSITTRIRLT
jgi:hypothetical protein